MTTTDPVIDRSHTTRLFIGQVQPLPSDGRPSAIIKTEVAHSLWLGREGLEGDCQANRRLHGGPEKALHQYPASHYARLAEAFPAAEALLHPGSIGENLSVAGWDETNTCIGDCFKLGEAIVEISEPRSPCWKIDSRFGVEGMTEFIDTHGLTGWYFRVLEAGRVSAGCGFELLSRKHPEVTVSALLALWKQHRPDPEALEAMAGTSALSENWVKKLRERARRLREWGASGKERL